MRLKRGTKVEIQCKKGIPSGSWRCGEIVCGNAHSYTVRYDDFNRINGDEFYERVPRESIRPSPPQISENWVPGDVVEALHCFTWKIATVLDVLGDHLFAVRLLGSYIELELPKYRLRSRQSWDGINWVIVKKTRRRRIREKRKKNRENVTCSVGSCSISDGNSYKGLFPKSDYVKGDGCCSDAESVCEKRENDAVGSEIHKLELHAYRCVIEALHASGPLTWDQEEMMTNLRVCLNISNDEHLLEIKNLVNFGTCNRRR